MDRRGRLVLPCVALLGLAFPLGGRALALPNSTRVRGLFSVGLSLFVGFLSENVIFNSLCEKRITVLLLSEGLL